MIGRRTIRLAGAALLLLCSGCQQQMARQPKYKPLGKSDFFSDGLTARQPVEGTLSQERFALDGLYIPKDSNAFPLPVTLELLDRGRQRFTIFCAPCHGALGDGQGFITTRGFRQPPSYHIDRLRGAPAGYFFDVMTNGFGAMPSYAAQIPPRDRWAIIAYIRALQLSQNYPAAQLGPMEREHLAPEAAPK
jgi:hypothetical protein